MPGDLRMVLAWPLACILGCGEAPPLPESPTLATWPVDPLPTLVIGGDEDEAASPLFRVAGAAWISEGLLVVNGSANELRLYSEDGRVLGRIGRQGSGPGEFLAPVMVGRLASDSVVVFDRRNTRLSVICDGREVCSEVRIEGNGLVVGVSGAQVVLEHIVFGTPASSGVNRNRHEYFAVTRATQESRLLATYAGQPTQTASEGAGTYMMPVLMTRPPQVAVLPGIVALASGSDPELDLVGFSGTALRTIPLPISVSEISDEEFAAAVAEDIGTGEGWDPLALAAMEAMGRPEQRAPTQKLLADRMGLVWVELEETPPDMRKWLVVDPRGTVLAEVLTPGDVSVLEVGEDYILGVRRDAVGVEFVESYSLDRGTLGGDG